MTPDNQQSQTCETCGQVGTDLDLEQTLEGKSICADCRQEKREKDASREAGQPAVTSYGGEDDG